MSIPTDIQSTYQLFIGGQWCDTSDGQTITTRSPATGEELADMAEATQEDPDSVVAAARATFQVWSQTTTPKHSNILLDIADILEDIAQFIATVETLDNGKTIRETVAVDLPAAVDHFRYFAGVLRVDKGTATMIDEKSLSIVPHEPLGVVGQIVPWEFLFLMAAWTFAPALATGDYSVLKPSSSTLLSTTEIVRLIGALLSDGALNLITRKGSKMGEYLKNVDVVKPAFTGSTEVGRVIALAAVKKTIPTTLEFVGKSANLFFDDCDRDLTIEGVQLGVLFHQGQVCSAGSRILVQDPFYDEFIDLAVAAFEKVKVGYPLDPETQIGSQINARHRENIHSYAVIGQSEGAQVLTGGTRLTEGDPTHGAFTEPTLLVGVDSTMRCAREEIFEPVGVVINVRDEEDVMTMANDPIYGLGRGGFTQDLGCALRVASGIRTGRVRVNTCNQIPAGAPFGGYKELGIGRETYESVLTAYQQVKNVYVTIGTDLLGFYPQD